MQRVGTVLTFGASLAHFRSDTSCRERERGEREREEGGAEGRSLGCFRQRMKQQLPRVVHHQSGEKNARETSPTNSDESTGVNAMVETAASGGQGNWVKGAVIIMLVWVVVTVLQESGTFGSLSQQLQLADSTLVPEYLKKKLGLLGGLNSKNSSKGFISVNDENQAFVYRHSVIDTISKDMVEEHDYRNNSLFESDPDVDAMITNLRNLTRDISTLPRTSDLPYNTLNPNKKYFLYSPSGGFNNQLISLINGMLIAKLTKRVLIVPCNGKHSNFWYGFLRLKQNQIIPMDHTLDFHHMQKISGIEMMPLNVTINDFVKMVPPGTIKNIKLPDDGLMQPSDFSVYRKLLAKAKNTKKQVAYFRGRFFTAHWLDKTFWQNARYAPYLQEVASSIANEFFQNGNFNAFHIRMGDYAARSHKHNPDASRYLKNAIGMGFEKHIPVYIASEEGRDFPYFKPLLDYFDTVVFQEDLIHNPRTRKWLVDYTLRTPSTPVRNDLFGLVEQLVCARAHNFLGTRISTFSKTIRVMRQKLKAAIPELWEDIKFRAERKEENMNVRRSGLHRWQGGPAQWTTDALGIKAYDGVIRQRQNDGEIAINYKTKKKRKPVKSKRRKPTG